MALNLFDRPFICVFCDERKRAGKEYIRTGDIGICKDCGGKLSKTAPSLPYQGTKSIAYIMSPFEYTGALRQTILDFKFKNCRAYAPLFAEMMKEYLASYDIWDSFDYIVPIPLHESRLKERGYNQSELIAKLLSPQIKLPVRTDVLIRTRATKRQSMLKRSDRVTNVQGAFACSGAEGKNIILFDDICTTGSTLEAAAEALKNAGAINICALTLSIHAVEKIPGIMY